MHHQETSSPVTLSFVTDTTRPHEVVPVFLIHTIEHPFCSNPGCICHLNHVVVAALLTVIQRGEMTLHDTAHFAARELF